jgi:hypothetical protein
MFSTTSSFLLHRRQPFLLYNVCGRHKLTRRQDTYPALLLAKLWLKETEEYEFMNKQTNNSKNFHEVDCDFTKQDLYRSNKKEQFKLSDDELVYTVSLIQNYMLNSEICENPIKCARLQQIKPRNSENKRWYLDKLTCDILYKTLGKHIDEQ